MAITTYLFGAGASIGALPIGEKIHERMRYLIKELKHSRYALSDTETFKEFNNVSDLRTKREYQIDMISDLEWLLPKAKDHASIDTYAKKLTLRKDQDLFRLKIALSIFFICEQARKPPDRRYDAFFASIISSLSKLPDKIRILTWNYDFQFEYAFSEFSGKNGLIDNQNWLRVKMKGAANLTDSGFGIFKLNGTAALYDDVIGINEDFFIDTFYSDLNKGAVERIVFTYAKTKHFQKQSGLSFAWEKDEQDFIGNFVIPKITDTKTLVVIGYSFPFFNREIDQKILNEMNLESVYFQSLEPEALQVRFKTLYNKQTEGVKFVLTNDVKKQFILPNELSI